MGLFKVRNKISGSICNVLAVRYDEDYIDEENRTLFLTDLYCYKWRWMCGGDFEIVDE